MTEVNTPLLRKALEWAKAESEKPRALREWDQTYYIMPKTLEELEDYNPGTSRVARRDFVAEYRETKDESCGTAFCIAGYVANITTGNMAYHRAGSIAEKELGLNATQSARLFDATNSIEELEQMFEEFTGERL